MHLTRSGTHKQRLKVLDSEVPLRKLALMCASLVLRCRTICTLTTNTLGFQFWCLQTKYLDDLNDFVELFRIYEVAAGYHTRSTGNDSLWPLSRGSLW